MKQKKAATYRLSAECIEAVKTIAADNGISQSAVIELAVREMKRREDRKK